MPTTDQTQITFDRPSPGTSWIVVAVQEMRTVHRMMIPDHALAYEFDARNLTPLRNALTTHALRLLKQGQSELIGIVIEPPQVDSWEPHGSPLAARVATRYEDLIHASVAHAAGDVTSTHATAYAAVRCHAASHVALLNDAVQRHIPGAEYILADLRPWFDTRDHPIVLGLGDEFGSMPATGHPAWAALRDLITEHLSCALETATPAMCGWRSLDPDLREADERLVTAAAVDTEDTDLFQIPIAGPATAPTDTAPHGDPWRDDFVQFARLIAETEAVGGFDTATVAALVDAMDLERADLRELVDRAQTVWERAKLDTPTHP
jgi:hypothetical protein